MERIELTREGRRFSAWAAGEGPVVLCVHGFPDHARSYRHQLPALAARGYRAVAPTLRGYEPSSQGGSSVAAYHPLESARDVLYFAKKLSVETPVRIVGHDWGGIITELAVALEPERFRSAVSIAAAPMHAMTAGLRRYPVQLRNSWYAMFFQLRGISDFAVRARNFAFLEKLWRDWSPGWQWEPEDMRALKASFAQPGVLWCALAYYRAMTNPRLAASEQARSLAAQPVKVPMLLLTGALDGCMDTRIHDLVDPAHYGAALRVERIADAGHFAHQEKPDEVNEVIGAWFEQE